MKNYREQEFDEYCGRCEHAYKTCCIYKAPKYIIKGLKRSGYIRAVVAWYCEKNINLIQGICDNYAKKEK